MKKLTSFLLLFLAVSLYGQQKETGRLLDTSCGSMSNREGSDHITRQILVHAHDCLTHREGKLAILTDSKKTIYLQGVNLKRAEVWRDDLANGEIYVYLDEKDVIHKAWLPKDGSSYEVRK